MIDARFTVLPDIPHVASNMRDEDIAEVFAASGVTPHESLMRGYLGSSECFTIMHLGHPNPLGLFGYKVIEPGRCGMVWMLGTKELQTYPIGVLRASKRWINKLHINLPLLYNVVDARNTVHIKWLDWLGFKFIRTIDKFGHSQIPFIEFARIHHV